MNPKTKSKMYLSMFVLFVLSFVMYELRLPTPFDLPQIGFFTAINIIILLAMHRYIKLKNFSPFSCCVGTLIALFVYGAWRGVGGLLVILPLMAAMALIHMHNKGGLSFFVHGAAVLMGISAAVIGWSFLELWAMPIVFGGKVYISPMWAGLLLVLVIVLTEGILRIVSDVSKGVK